MLKQVTKTSESKRCRKLEDRTTEEVFLDHLEHRKAGRLDLDIERNYAPDVMIVSNFGTFFGHTGVSDNPARC